MNVGDKKADGRYGGKQRKKGDQRYSIPALKSPVVLLHFHDLSRNNVSSPQCRLCTLHPCSTEAACVRASKLKCPQAEGGEGEFSLSQTPTQMLTISIT